MIYYDYRIKYNAIVLNDKTSLKSLLDEMSEAKRILTIQILNVSTDVQYRCQMFGVATVSLYTALPTIMTLT